MYSKCSKYECRLYHYRINIKQIVSENQRIREVIICFIKLFLKLFLSNIRKLKITKCQVSTKRKEKTNYSILLYQA